jgi:plastocyanin
VTIHTGDTLDFRAAPGSFHIVSLAKSEKVARQVYPVAFADSDHDGADLATGSGTNKVVFGPSNFPITGGSTHGGGSIAFNNGFGPPVCGVAAFGEKPCTFAGGDDIEVIGPTPGFDATGTPAFVDQLVQINAAPGDYDYFCFIHPGMRGKLKVVDADDGTTTQAQIDRRSRDQFEDDRDAGLKLERDSSEVKFSGGAPGTRTYEVRVGVGSEQSHVAIDEMLPNKALNLAPGDKVHYVWQDPHNVHSVGFPAGSANLPEPFGFDCGPNPPFYLGIPPVPGAPPPAVCIEPGDTQPEVIGDPGNAAPGTRLTTPTQLVDAGVRVGTGYGVKPSSQAWSVTTDSHTAAGSYAFQCTVHDWMRGVLQVS